MFPREYFIIQLFVQRTSLQSLIVMQTTRTREFAKFRRPKCFMFPREYFIIQIFIQRTSLQYSKLLESLQFSEQTPHEQKDARVRQFFYFFFLASCRPRRGQKKARPPCAPPPTCPPGRRVFTCVAGLVQLKQRCRVFD